MIVHVFCKCDNQQPEEIKRGVYQCTNCLNDINPADFAEDEPDFSECRDLVEDDTQAYESRQVEDVTGDYNYR